MRSCWSVFPAHSRASGNPTTIATLVIVVLGPRFRGDERIESTPSQAAILLAPINHLGHLVQMRIDRVGHVAEVAPLFAEFR